MVTTGARLEASHEHDFAARRVWELTCSDCGHVEHSDAKPPRHRSVRRRRRHLRWAEMYAAGATTTDIGTAEGVRPSTVSVALRRLGVTMRGRGPKSRGSRNPERDGEIVRRVRDEHLTLEQVATEFGITRQRVKQICSRAGVDVRGAQKARLAEARQARRRRVCPLHGPYVVGDGSRHVGHANSPLLHPERQERDARLAADYAAGVPINRMCVTHGVQPSAIMRAVRRHGVERRRPNVGRIGTMEEIRARQRAIRAAIDGGQRQQDVAREFGVSRSYVSGIAKGVFGASA